MQRDNEWYLNAMSHRQAYIDAMTQAHDVYDHAHRALNQAAKKNKHDLALSVEAASAKVRQSIVDRLDADEANENFEGHAIFVSDISPTGRCHIGSPVTERNAYIKLVDRARVGSTWMVDGYAPGGLPVHFGAEEQWTQPQAMMFAKRWVTETS